MAKHNITIDDIARDLGVSKTTISRAISGKGRISEATREKVKEYIKANWRRILAAGVLLIIFLYSAVRLGRYAVQSILTKRTNEELQELFDGAEGETGPEPEEAGAGQELLM